MKENIIKSFFCAYKFNLHYLRITQCYYNVDMWSDRRKEKTSFAVNVFYTTVPSYT